MQKDENADNKNQDLNESTSSMLDTKNAFIKDLENIDVEDHLTWKLLHQFHLTNLFPITQNLKYHKISFQKCQDSSENPSTSYQSLTEEQKAEIAQKNLQLQEDLESATALLEADQAKQERQNRTVQEHMVEECKELLQLFGVPFRG
ncbi:DNA repair protein complementing XP-G cells [Caerostris extrusa]|uniref:DNA repair protein complementing XP-G cells n=1 Tax=Caerostris extrusa TaxID=172846 RepID=A0AAV4V1K9_CAEEX|nr:DNA repair protein complementing XP-G cells [Caerostris extrusa]